MREITALPAPGRATLGGELWRWLRRPHQFTLTPLGGLVAAAALTVGVLLYRMASTPPVRRTPTVRRSEEHTSELQSHSDLVCRLLLEKKKKANKTKM